MKGLAFGIVAEGEVVNKTLFTYTKRVGAGGKISDLTRRVCCQLTLVAPFESPSEESSPTTRISDTDAIAGQAVWSACQLEVQI